MTQDDVKGGQRSPAVAALPTSAAPPSSSAASSSSSTLASALAESLSSPTPVSEQVRFLFFFQICFQTTGRLLAPFISE